MRKLLVIVAAVAALCAASNTRAQTFIANSYPKAVEEKPFALPPAVEAFAPVYLYQDQAPMFRTSRNDFALSLGSVRFAGQGSSLYPANNQKIRNDSAYLSIPLSDETDLRFGASRWKFQQEGLPQLRSLTIGFVISRKR